MSLGRREAILVRLLAILDEIEGMETAVRNRAGLDNDQRPGLILMDGDESTTRAATGRGRQKMSPVIVRMAPEIFIVLKTEKIKNEGQGTKLNQFRGELLSAIGTDAELLALVGPNGEIQYLGCETDMKSGSPMDGQMRLDLAITTVLDPYKD